MNTSSALRYASFAVVAVMLAVLAFWYFFIQAKQEKITKADANRGAGITPPSFGSAVGSTYENIVSSLSTLVGGENGNEYTDETFPQLAQVGKTPTAGLGFVRSARSATKENSIALRFVERSTGYIFDVDPKTGAVKRLTNTLIPHIYEAIVTEKGIVVRGTDETSTITTAIGTISASSSADTKVGTLVQKLLPSGIRTIIASPSGNELFYIAREKGLPAIDLAQVGLPALPAHAGQAGEWAGIRTAWDGAKPKQIFSSNLSEWQMHLASNDRVIIAQRPSDNVAGSAYVLGNDGTLIPIVRNVPGLSILPHPSSAALLYGSSGGGLSLFVRIDEKSTIVALPIRTVADKCVWNPASPKATQGKSDNLVAYCAVPKETPSANFLNSWYRGEEHTNDAWWRIDAGAASAELLFSPDNALLDVESPVIDDENNYIAFINARDKTPWLLRIKE